MLRITRVNLVYFVMGATTAIMAITAFLSTTLIFDDVTVAKTPKLEPQATVLKTSQLPYQNHAMYRVINDWESLLVEEMTPEEISLIEDFPIDHILASIVISSNVRAKLINYIKVNDETATRWFFIRVLRHLKDDLKVSFIDKFLSSERMIDFNTALSLIMSLTEQNMKRDILATLLLDVHDQSRINLILDYIDVNADFVQSGLLKTSLRQFFDAQKSLLLKAKTLKVMRPNKVNIEWLFEQAISLLQYNDNALCYATLEVFNEWAFNHHALLSSVEFESLLTKLNNISGNASFNIDTRLKALEVYKNLE